jgi:hypothetical protein
MRRLTARIIVAGILGATLVLSTAAAAFADTNSTTTTTNPSTSNQTGDWLNIESNYLSHRHAIRMSYKQAVISAHMAFNAAMAHAHNTSNRNGARATLLGAIASADAQQTSALAALGTGPQLSGLLDNSEYLLERQAINQDYSDVVDAEQITYQAEVAAAAGSAQKVTARANLKLSIAQATIQRSTELISLGAKPPKHKNQAPGFTTITIHRSN